MDRRAKLAAAGSIFVLVVIVIAVSAILIKRFTPSREVMPLEEYYQAEEGDVLVMLHDQYCEETAKLIDGQIYFRFDMVQELFNHRFYWDENENILSYTTPTEIIRAEVGSQDYTVNMNKTTVQYQIVKTQGDAVYLAAEFVKQYSDMDYQFYEDPDRVTVQYEWKDYLYADVRRATQLRTEPDIKSPILRELETGEKLLYVDAATEQEQNGFVKVMTADGIIGYVQTRALTDSYYETLESDFEAPVYTSIQRDYTINMVWHQVTNQSANDNVMSLLENTKGITAISPTWFRIASVDGTLSSLASESYVARMKEQGIEVWALVDNFHPDVDTFQVLSYTSRRERLVNEIIAAAIKYGLNGINIDFESLDVETGPHYIQFLRELSVKCRTNGIVLSVDNYVPASYNAFYDREEQGEIVDYVIIMGYDEHHSRSETAGSVASIGYTREALENTLEEVPAEKIIMGIPFYTRLWREATIDGVTSLSSEALSMASAESVIEQYGAEPVWDEETGQYYIEYERDGAVYKMWQEEERSIEEKMKVIHDAQIAGVAAWRLGYETPEIWNVILRYVN
ncbi:MAG TPA: glycosyl hydrolase family 18 [Candidatus Caccomorpha excrementavium]|nr:glycosyl hydrolase family 18 [Candidatus Caccomorpha excrementavium]